MLRFAATIFLGAFLLFQVQPMMGKVILPWFGGGASIWTTCMLFFQIGLLAGYLYAHCLTTFLRPAVQGWTHAALLTASLLALPNPTQWKPAPGAEPIGGILLLLAVNVGVPFMLLSSTGPLLQAWFSRSLPGRSPYRLYALSNAASLLALLSYPIAVETMIGASVQLVLWSASYAAFVIACGYCAVRYAVGQAFVPAWQTGMSAPREETGGTESSRHAPRAVTASPPTVDFGTTGAASRVLELADGTRSVPATLPPRVGTILLWLGLAACGSAMLLATTNQLCQEVAVVPFLWIVPLVLYLLSFVICFDSPRWYERTSFALFLVNMAAWAVICLFMSVSMPLPAQMLIYPCTLLACCMTCHGELARAKPAPEHLTLFYLMIALGGALGGLSVALVAPRVFPTYWEYHVALAGCCLLTLIAWRRDGFTPLVKFISPAIAWAALIAAFGLLVAMLGTQAWHTHGQSYVRLAMRSFYGALRVQQTAGDADAPEPLLKLVHGQISHGFQYQEGDRLRPCSYYAPQSGVGLAVELLRAQQPKGLRIGVVGLGTGTMAAYGRAGDSVRFYEINPQVRDLSCPDFFTYLGDSPAVVDVELGDARVRMEQQLRDGEPQDFDLLAVDAFSSDSIPIHLLTRECADVYWQHLKPDGVLAIHISNRFLSLGGVTRGLAELRPGCQALRIDYNGDNQGGSPSGWVLLTSSPRVLAADEIAGNRAKSIDSRVTPWTAKERPIVWTDDFHGLWPVIRWKS